MSSGGLSFEQQKEARRQAENKLGEPIRVVDAKAANAEIAAATADQKAQTADSKAANAQGAVSALDTQINGRVSTVNSNLITLREEFNSTKEPGSDSWLVARQYPGLLSGLKHPESQRNLSYFVNADGCVVFRGVIFASGTNTLNSRQLSSVDIALARPEEQVLLPVATSTGQGYAFVRTDGSLECFGLGGAEWVSFDCAFYNVDV